MWSVLPSGLCLLDIASEQGVEPAAERSALPTAEEEGGQLESESPIPTF